MHSRYIGSNVAQKRSEVLGCDLATGMDKIDEPENGTFIFKFESNKKLSCEFLAKLREKCLTLKRIIVSPILRIF